MLVTFDQLSDDARIWIYQADRELAPDELSQISMAAEKFLDSWQAHGKDLQASYKVVKGRFLIIGVEQSFNMATGCSIDGSVGFVKSLGEALNIDFFDRTQITYEINGVLHDEELGAFRQKVKQGAINEEALIYNNAITSLGELNNKWLTSLKDSWAGRLMPQSAV